MAPFIISFLIAIFTAFIGGEFTASSLDWYNTLNLPAITPPGWVISLVWTLIFILSAVSAGIFFRKEKVFSRKGRVVASLFIFNILLNISWSKIFFGNQNIQLAFPIAVLLGLSVLSIIFAVGKKSISGILLYPYVIWAIFASVLNFLIIRLN